LFPSILLTVTTSGKILEYLEGGLFFVIRLTKCSLGQIRFLGQKTQLNQISEREGIIWEREKIIL
jgi:hypothetical protein